MKKIGAMGFLVVCIVAVGQGWYMLKGGFSVRRLEGLLPLMHQPFQPLSQEAQQALTQHYSYLGHGRQCYAFVSDDGQYVIKLPRLDCYEVSVWSRMFPKIANRQRTVRYKRKEWVANSFLIASQELKDLTETLYCHLDPTTHIRRSLCLSDALGRRFSMDLDQKTFLLQRKRPVLIDVFLQSVKQGHLAKAQEVLSAYLELTAARAKKGVFNKDSASLSNYGFDGTKAMQIDVGSFYHKKELSEREAFVLSFKETANHMKGWIAQVAPEMEEWFSMKVRQIVE